MATDNAGGDDDHGDDDADDEEKNLFYWDAGLYSFWSTHCTRYVATEAISYAVPT